MTSGLKHPWTLESELAKLTGTKNWSEAFVSTGLADQNGEITLLRSQDEWERGGAETFVYRFWTVDGAGVESAHILKACVPGIGVPLEKVLAEWMNRRSQLEAEGASVPRLYTFAHGLIWEELLPLRLEAALARVSNAKAAALLTQLATTLNTMLQLRFDPVDPTYDLWSRGDDVVIIDFGQDLGPSRREPNASKYVASFQKFVAQNASTTDEAIVRRCTRIITDAAGLTRSQIN